MTPQIRLVTYANKRSDLAGQRCLAANDQLRFAKSAKLTGPMMRPPFTGKTVAMSFDGIMFASDFISPLNIPTSDVAAPGYLSL